MKKSLAIFASACLLAFGLMGGAGKAPGVLAAEGWDGQSYDISWYIEAGGDKATSFEISTPEELNGLSLLTEWAVLSEKRSSSDPTYRKICYDENNRLIVDTDADKTLTDEAGYSADRTFTEGGNRFQGRTFTLKQDIDLNGKAWRPLGMSGGFNGILKGDGHTVSHFVINNESVTPNPVGGTSANRYYSFILTTSGNNAQITGLTLADATFVVDSDIDNLYISAFVGRVYGTQIIEDCAIRNVTIQVKKTGNKVTSFGYVVAQYTPNYNNQPLSLKNVTADHLKVEKGELSLGPSIHDGWLSSATEKTGSTVETEGLKVGNFTHVPGDWGSDETQHWKICTLCGEKIEETAAEHDYGEEYFPGTDGHYKQCECGKKTEETPHTMGWKQTEDKAQHYKVCEDCGMEEAKAPHVLTWKLSEDSSKHYQVCECGYQTEAVAHDALSYEDNGDGSTHKVTCGTCELEVNAEEAHAWEWAPVPGEAKEKATCAKCGAEGETRSTHEHQPVKHDAKAPTCTENGNPEYYTCEGEGDVCTGKYYKDATCTTEYTAEEIVLKAIGHDLTETAAKEASCTAEGNTKYYTCKTCGKYFADDKGENEIAENSWVTEKTDHVFASTEWSRDAEKHWHECANNCGTRSAEAAHTFEDGVCTVCGAADPSYVKPDSPDTSDRALLSGMVLLTVLSGAAGPGLLSRPGRKRKEK